MIIEDYVSLETAKFLKERGFNEICFYEYGVPNVDKGYVLQRFFKPIQNVELIDDAYTAPTLQMAMKWLREKHKLYISIGIGFDVDNPQYYFFAPSICRFSDKSGEYETPFGETEFNTYEEAAEAAIKYCLENLI